MKRNVFDRSNYHYLYITNVNDVCTPVTNAIVVVADMIHILDKCISKVFSYFDISEAESGANKCLLLTYNVSMSLLQISPEKYLANDNAFIMYTPQ